MGKIYDKRYSSIKKHEKVKTRSNLTFEGVVTIENQADENSPWEIDSTRLYGKFNENKPEIDQNSDFQEMSLLKPQIKQNSQK